MTDWILSYLKYIEKIISNDIKMYAERKIKLRLPKFSSQMISTLCAEATKVLEKEPTVLRVSTDQSPIVIVGDIHGHLLDLLLIFKKFGSPRIQRYLFMGDIVDRGEFSLETIVLLLAIKVCYPNNALIIRGNHECRSMFEVSGFGDDIKEEYAESNVVINDFETVFSYLPLACVVNKEYFCVHGGISPSFTEIATIEAIRKPILDTSSESIVADLLWSDPSEIIPFFMPSSRGNGFLYGLKSLENFFKTNQLQKIIRAHQCVYEGIQYSLCESVITVFSASNYCGVTHNKGGVLIIESNDIKEHTYGPLPYLKRSSVIFVNNESDTNFIPPSRKDSVGSFDNRKIHSFPLPERREGLPLINVKKMPRTRRTSLSIPANSPIIPYILPNKAQPKSGTNISLRNGVQPRLNLRQSPSSKIIPKPRLLHY